jgi:hypothetical protein
MQCDARHPELNVNCWLKATHAEHAGYLDGNPLNEQIYWTNEAFIPTVKPGKEAAQKHLARLAQKLPQPAYSGSKVASGDSREGHSLKEVAMESVIAGTDDEWKGAFIKAQEELASTGQPFTSETVIDCVGLSDEAGSLKNNVVGALMAAASKRGLIQKTGEHVSSSRPRSHGAELTVWVGVPRLRNFD